MIKKHLSMLLKFISTKLFWLGNVLSKKSYDLEKPKDRY